MDSKKIIYIILPVIIIAILIIFSSALFPLTFFSGKVTKKIDIPGSIYSDSFEGWRDNTTDPGFNTWIQLKRCRLKVSTRHQDYGKTMSKSEPIPLDISPKTEMVVDVVSIDPGAIATIRIMNAYEPYDSYQVARVLNKNGKYKVNLHKRTGWTGAYNIWLEVWLEGKRKTVTFNDIYFMDENAVAKQKKQAALKKYVTKKFTPVPQNSLFFEDFRKGVQGWRTGETDPGFNSEISFENGKPRLKLKMSTSSGKIMSAAKGIRAQITPSTEFEIVVGDMGTARIKVDLMTANAPFDSHSIMQWISQPGHYRSNIFEMTQWQGNKVFWIQIWIETTTNPQTEQGIVIKKIVIRDGSLVSNNKEDVKIIN